MAMDSIMQYVSEHKPDTSLMFMCTPTDVYAVPKEVAEAILGHSKKGIEGVYDLHEYENESAIWLQKWSNHLFKILQN